eukprot:TRINITY_DN32467_c0_g1_i1.p1 TRINITY_DN32467_c0_g1~~TRINITY_DN32467_c0_g1_i1.p1  ORF type:complete len:328 (+),score=82.82 TRINITY_DN32467_c0_g1_i1:41-1024(+)
MGITQSEPYGPTTDLLQLHCSARPEACGVYRRCGTDTTTLVISKGDSDLVGVTYNEEGVIRGVEPGSVGDTHGLTQHIGKRVMNKEALDASLGRKEVELCIQDLPWIQNGQYVWSHGSFHLYSTREGKWMLTDSKEGVEKNCGYAMTSAHGGVPPHEAPFWMVYNRAKGSWVVDASFAVWEFGEALFAAGQLVEFKADVEAEGFSQGIIEKLHPLPAPAEAGNYRQYSIRKQGSTADPVDVFATCVRSLEAYRRDVAEVILTKSASSSALGVSAAEAPADSEAAQGGETQARVDGSTPIAATVLQNCVEKGKFATHLADEDVAEEKC